MTLRYIVARILRELIELAGTPVRTRSWSTRCTMRSMWCRRRAGCSTEVQRRRRRESVNEELAVPGSGAAPAGNVPA